MVMTVNSKIQLLPLSDILGTSSCQQVFHEWTSSCMEATLDIFFSCVRGWSLFFFPIYLLQVLVKWRKLTWISLFKDIKGFFRSVCFGTILITNIFTGSCLLRKILGGYSIYLSVLIPTTVGATAIFIEQKQRKMLLATYFAAMVMDSTVYWLEQNNLLHTSKIKYTFIFMCVNAVIMYLYRTKKKMGNSEDSSIMWFFQPPYHSQLSKIADKTQENTQGRSNSKTEIITNLKLCPHEGTCKKYILKCTSKYAAIGLVFQLVRTVIVKFQKVVNNPRMLPLFLLDKQNFKFSMFLGGHVFIYWVTQCLLCHYWNHNSSCIAPIISGFLSGISYYVHPERSICFYALSTMISLLLRHCVHANLLPSVTHTDCWVFVLCAIFLVHSYCFFYSACPQAFKSMINIGTRGRSLKIVGGFHSVMKQYYYSLQYT